MIADIGTVWAVLWALAIAGFFLLVVPVVLWLATRVIRELILIQRYAADILEHGVGLAGNLDPVPELLKTRELIGQVTAGASRYAGALDRIVSGGGR